MFMIYFLAINVITELSLPLLAYMGYINGLEIVVDRVLRTRITQLQRQSFSN